MSECFSLSKFRFIVTIPYGYKVEAISGEFANTSRKIANF